MVGQDKFSLITWASILFRVSPPESRQYLYMRRAIIERIRTLWSFILYLHLHIFPPLPTCSFFYSHRDLFALILPYFTIRFTLLLTLFSFFSLSSFFFYIFPLFLFDFSKFFPQTTSAEIFFPSGGGGGYFPIYRPLDLHLNTCTQMVSSLNNQEANSSQHTLYCQVLSSTMHCIVKRGSLRILHYQLNSEVITFISDRS